MSATPGAVVGPAIRPASRGDVHAKAAPARLEPEQLRFDDSPAQRRPRSSMDSEVRRSTSNRFATFFPSPMAGPRAFLATPDASPVLHTRAGAGASANASPVPLASRATPGGDSFVHEADRSDVASRIDDTPSAVLRLTDPDDAVMSPQSIRANLAAYEHYETQLRGSVERFEGSERDFLKRHYALIDPIASVTPLRNAIQQSRVYSSSMAAMSFAQESNASIVAFDEFANTGDLSIVESQARARIRVRRELWLERSREELQRDLTGTLSRQDLLTEVDDVVHTLHADYAELLCRVARLRVEDRERAERVHWAAVENTTFQTKLSPYFDREAARLRLLRDAKCTCGDVAFEEALERDDLLVPFFSGRRRGTESDETATRRDFIDEEMSCRRVVVSELLDADSDRRRGRTRSDEAVAFEMLCQERDKADARMTFEFRHRLDRADVTLACVQEWHGIVDGHVELLLGDVQRAEDRLRLESLLAEESTSFKGLRRLEKIQRLTHHCNASATAHAVALARRYFSSKRSHASSKVAFRKARDAKLAAMQQNNAMLLRRRFFTRLRKFLVRAKQCRAAGRLAERNRVVQMRRAFERFWLRTVVEHREGGVRASLRENALADAAHIEMLRAHHRQRLDVEASSLADRAATAFMEALERLQLSESRSRCALSDVARAAERVVMLNGPAGREFCTVLVQWAQVCGPTKIARDEAVARRRLSTARSTPQVSILASYCAQRLRRLGWDRLRRAATGGNRQKRTLVTATSETRPSSSGTAEQTKSDGPIVAATLAPPSVPARRGSLAVLLFGDGATEETEGFPGLQMVLELSADRHRESPRRDAESPSRVFPALTLLTSIDPDESFPTLRTVMAVTAAASN